MILGLSVVKSMMVEGRWPVRDLGVPPLGFAEVRRRGPFVARSLGNRGWAGMRMPILSKWS